MVVIGSEAYHMDPFIVGKWNDTTKTFDLDMNKILALNERKSTNIKHCETCPAKLHCGGYCLGEIVNETGRLDGQNLVKCQAIRKLFEKIGICDTFPYLHP